MITQTKLLIEKQQNAPLSLVKLGQLYGSSKNLAIAELLNKNLLSVIVCPNSDSALSVFKDLRFFSNNEIVFYKNINDLSYKLNKYKKDKKNGKKIAKKGKLKYLKYFNSDIVAEYILSKTFEYKNRKKPIWN